MRPRLSFIVVTCAIALTTSASDKDSYTLLSPTPPNLMRKFETDRPSKTDTPHTIDAGHLQLESEVVGYVYDDTNGTRTDAWSFMSTQFRLGLLSNTELSLTVQPFKWERSKSDGDETRHEGFGITTIGIRQNLWGNDGGKTALALFPFISLPTSQDDLGNDKVQGGLIIPFQWQISDKTNLGIMAEENYLEDAGGSGYHFEQVLSSVLQQELTDKFTVYVELYGAMNWEEKSDPIATFDTGLMYKLTDNIQLDAGVNIGLTDSAEDVNPFIGLSMRF